MSMVTCTTWGVGRGGVISGEVMDGVKDFVLGHDEAEYSTGIPHD